MLSSNRKSLIKENSNFSSNIQTESTSGISYTQIKNLKLLKYSIKRRNIKKSRNILKIPKLNLKTDIHNKKINHNANKNFLYSFSKERKSNKLEKIINLKKYKDKSAQLKNLSRNNNDISKYYSTELNNNSVNYKYNNDSSIYDKLKEPLYQLYTSRKDSLLDFKAQTRNIRLLKIDSYNGQKALNSLKESLLYNETKTLQFEYSKDNEKKLLNIFKNNFHSYLIYLKRKADRENNINENLIEKKNYLKGKILTMGSKINKILRKFEHYLESKSFLLCIKECSLNFQKFSKESQIDILYDLYKLYNYKNQNFQTNILNNSQDFKKWIEKNAKIIIESDSMKKSAYFNFIITSIDTKNFFDIFNCINENYIKYHKVKNIFESVDDFNRTLLNDQSHIRLSLDKFSVSISGLNELKNDLIYEKRRKIKIVQELNLSKNKRNLFNEKLNIAKTNYLDKILDNENYSKEKNKINLSEKIIDKINKILNYIIEYDSIDIRKIKFEKENKKITTIIDKVRYIEKVLNFLFKYKEEQKNINSMNYEKVMKEFKKEQIMRKFRNKEETMKKIQELKIKKILEKKDKILFLPHKK
jgi:hypothetical protein